VSALALPLCALAQIATSTAGAEASTSTSAATFTATSAAGGARIAASPGGIAAPAAAEAESYHAVVGATVGAFEQSARTGGTLELALAVHPFGGVADDDTPRIFQAFAQHRSTVLLSLRGSDSVASNQGVDVVRTIGTIALAADLYLDPRLVFTAAAEIGRLGESVSNAPAGVPVATSSITGSHSGASVGLAFHGKDTRVDIGFRYLGEQTTISLAPFPLNAPSVFVPRETGGYASVRSLFDRALLVRGEAHLFSNGAGASAGAEYAFTHDLSMLAAFAFFRLSRDSGATIETELDGALSAAWWAGAAWRLGASYTVVRTTSSALQSPSLAHFGSLSLAFRW
jgi:hypothetical protein